MRFSSLMKKAFKCNLQTILYEPSNTINTHADDYN